MSTIISTEIDPARAPGADQTDDALEQELVGLQSGGISLRETFEIALSSLTANKLRTLPTALGVIIGVASVIALMAIGRGSQESITATMTANGANRLTVRSDSSAAGGVGGVGSAQTLTVADAKALADPQAVPSVTFISAEYNGNGQLVAGSQNQNARITGAQSTYMSVHNLKVAEGDFISDEQDNSAASVIVLGANVATTLFPDADALGAAVTDRGASQGSNQC